MRDANLLKAGLWMLGAIVSFVAMAVAARAIQVEMNTFELMLYRSAIGFAVVVVALENKIGDLGAWLARTTGVEWFSTLGESVTIVTGLIFVLCVLLFRKGIMGELIAWLEKKR